MTIRSALSASSQSLEADDGVTVTLSSRNGLRTLAVIQPDPANYLD